MTTRASGRPVPGGLKQSGTRKVHEESEVHQLKPSLLAARLCVVAAIGFSMVPPSHAQIARSTSSINVGLHTDATIPDPHKTRDLTSFMIMQHVCENLVSYDEEYNFIPQLAEKWSVEDGGKSYIFDIRKGITFHNGKELLAEDVKWSLDRTKVVSPQRGDFSGVDNITVEGPHRLKVSLKEPSPGFLAAVAGPYTGFIMPKDLDKQQNGEITKPICSGPYEYIEWRPDQYVRLKKYANYKPDERFPGPTGFGGKRTAKLEEIIWRIVPDRSARITGLSSGELDFSTRIDMADYESLEKNPNIIAIQNPSLNWILFWFGVTNSPASDLKFRQAVTAAIDIDQISQIAQDKYAIPNAAPVHSSQKQWRTASMSKKYEQNLDRARKLLAESAYKGETITLYSTNEMEYMSNGALALQQQLAAIGVKIELKLLDMGGLIQTAYAKEPKYVMSMISSAGRMDPHQHFFNRWHSSNAVNKYNNPEYDKVVEAARFEMDVEKRKALYDRAQEILFADIPSVIMFNPAFFDAANKRVKGYKPLTIGFLRFWDVTLEK